VISHHKICGYKQEITMLIGIGLFLAVVLLLLIGYVGEMISSVSQEDTEEETSYTFESDPVLGVNRPN